MLVWYGVQATLILGAAWTTHSLEIHWMTGFFIGYLGTSLLMQILISVGWIDEDARVSRARSAAHIEVDRLHLHVGGTKLELRELRWKHVERTLEFRSGDVHAEVSDVPRVPPSLESVLRSHRRRARELHGNGESEVPDSLRQRTQREGSPSTNKV